MVDLDWTSASTEILHNPTLQEKPLRSSQLPRLKGFIWLSSSGTTQTKVIALSKQAILLSAKIVNEYIQSNSKDKWLNVLPPFHMGGLSIYARSHLSGAKVVDIHGLWSPTAFCQALQEHSTTLTSLVPTQVYDLVKKKLKAPKNVRGVFVGGSPLSALLYQKAVEGGWPLLPTYGLTECSGQVATQDLQNLASPHLKILPHVKVRVSSGGLDLKSPSLFSYTATVEKDSIHISQREGGWYSTSDLGEKKGQELVIYGRRDEQVKVGGNFVSLSKLNQVLSQIVVENNLEGEWLAVANPDERLRFKVDLVTTNLLSLNSVIGSFCKRVRDCERFRTAYIVDELPKSHTGKVKLHALKKLLGFES